MSDSRLEKFIYAICSMDVSDLPVPLSRIEKLWNCLITGETPDFEPLSRNEKYLMAMLDRYDISNLPAPMSRGEKLLYKIAVGETDLSDVPGYLSRYEELLKCLIENGEISEDDFEYVLYTLNQSLSTLYTTAEKPVKSAILKGQTLVNITSDKKIVGSAYIRVGVDNNLIKPNVQYTLIVSGYSNVSRISCVDNNGLNPYFNIATPKQWNIFTTPNDLTNHHIRVYGTSIDDTLLNSIDIILVEGDYTNVDIPYFEGMQSVKMPVLTTNNLGNLVSVNDFEQGGFFNHSGAENTLDFCRSGFIDVEFPQYTLSHSGSGCWTQIFEFDENKKYIKYSNKNSNKYTATLENNTKYIRVCVSKTFANIDSYDISLCPYESTNKEPYKSNILTVNEDVTLRGIGEVKDELDVLTGEVTQRIGSFNDWDNADVVKVSNYGLVSRFDLKIDVKPRGKIKANLFPQGSIKTSDLECVAVHSSSQSIQTQVLTSKLSSDTVDGFKEWAKNNNYTIQYQLAESTIKTVDLTIVNQDNQPTELGTFENVTHVSLEAENLIPEVEMEVATRISTELASANLLMDDISTKQEQLNTTIDEQSNNVDATMIATTEIFEETL